VAVSFIGGGNRSTLREMYVNSFPLTVDRDPSIVRSEKVNGPRHDIADKLHTCTLKLIEECPKVK
jgi:hypothetical protein